MTEPVQRSYDILLSGLAKAGRNKSKVSAFLASAQAELSKQAGYNTVSWAEEYFEYLLEVYRLSLEEAIRYAVSIDEFEWAASMHAQVTSITKQESLEKKRKKEKILGK